MDNSETKQKKNRNVMEEITKSSNYIIENKWSIVRVNIQSSDCTKKERAFALNYFLNSYLLNNKMPIYRNARLNEFVYKYRLLFKDEEPQNYASFSQYHSILASLVIDLPKADNESGVVTALKENYMKFKEFALNNEETTLEFESSIADHKRLYKGMLKHIIISDKDLVKIYNIDTLRELPKANTYSIEKK